MPKKDIKTVESVKNAVTDVTPKNNKKLNKQSKCIIAVVSVVLVLALAVGGWYLYERNANKWDVKQKEITIEYGEVYEPTINDFVDNETYPDVIDSNTTIKVNASYEVDLNNDNKPLGYYAVGDYDIVITHKIEYKLFGIILFKADDVKKVKLSVKDTKAPIFSEDSPTEIETYKDCEIENIEEKFTATDKAPVTISIDKENIDYSTVGEYITNVYATDANGNVANKEIKVKVNEPSINIEPSSIELTVGDTATLTVTVKGKEQNIEWSSSDESIAKVDNGNVTANSAGTATITAKANGVEKTCEVVVKNKVATSNTNRQSSGTVSASNSRSTSHSSGGGNTNTSLSTSNNNQGSSNSNQHNIAVGNMGRWFNTRSELVSYYQSILNEWNNKINSGSITWEEYTKNCPQGYEAYSCSHCGKWTGNFK